jgi:NAD(P)-dependent dehydrogenase (short-subunit alcohol dehydrogenase family)
MSRERILAGKTAFITGASGGIGSASAKLLVGDGAAVLLMGRRMGALEEAKGRLLAEVPDARIELHAGDAGKEEDVKAGIEKAYAIQNRLDIAVPTVGGGGFSPLLLATADDFRNAFDLNVVTTFLAVRYSVPLMEPGGAIVCISSTAAKLPFAYLPAYHTAKGALENFVRAAAEELGSAGIRINAVRPGLTRSDATGPMFGSPDILKSFIAEFPLGRAGEPEDIAAAVRYLAGPESSWVTGQSFAVDGGNEIRKNPDLTAMMEQMIGKEKLATVRRGKIPT